MTFKNGIRYFSYERDRNQSSLYHEFDISKHVFSFEILHFHRIIEVQVAEIDSSSSVENLHRLIPMSSQYFWAYDELSEMFFTVIETLLYIASKMLTKFLIVLINVTKSFLNETSSG